MERTSALHFQGSWISFGLINIATGFDTAHVYLSFFFLLFLAALSRRSLGRSSPNFATCSTVTQIYKIGSEIWGPPPKFGGPKISNFQRNL